MDALHPSCLGPEAYSAWATRATLKYLFASLVDPSVSAAWKLLMQVVEKCCHQAWGHKVSQCAWAEM